MDIPNPNVINEIGKMTAVEKLCAFLNVWVENKERDEFAGATKVSIYMEEKSFLVTKWA